jgi:hypothetical protein
MKNYWLKMKVFLYLMPRVLSIAADWPHTQACTSRCNTTIEDSTSIGCNFAHQKTKSKILIDFWLKMAMFVVSSIHSSYDRPLDYHFSRIHITCTLYWHYRGHAKSAPVCAWRNNVWFCHIFAMCEILLHAHKRRRPSYPTWAYSSAHTMVW